MIEEMETADEILLSVQENQGAAVQTENEIPESKAPASSTIQPVEMSLEKVPVDVEKKFGGDFDRHSRKSRR